MALMALGLLIFLSGPEASELDESPWVLVINSFRTTLPANAEWQHGIVAGLDSTPGALLNLAVESADLSVRSGPAYLEELREIYRSKYRDDQPTVVITTFAPALDFLLKYGEELFPGVPLVFCAADTGFVSGLELPSHVTGITSAPDVLGTLELIMDLHPETETIAFVVGVGKIDLGFERHAQRALKSFDGEPNILWLRGLSIDQLQAAVAGLPPEAVVLYLVQHTDQSGVSHAPARVLERLSAATSIPIYGLWDTLIGRGVVGGRMMRMRDDGYQAGRIAARLVEGVAPADIPVTYQTANRPVFDAPMLAKWDIDIDSLPTESLILNHQPSVWERYRREIMIVGLFVVLQTVLILVMAINRARLNQAQVALHAESDRRKKAESMTLSIRERLAKLTKERFLGAVATGIAHEINQPLIAIQNYAQAAKRRASSDTPQMPKLAELLEKIEDQAGRVGDIVKKVRALVSSDYVDLEPTSLNSIVERILELMAPTFATHRCRIEYIPGVLLPPAAVDELQIQLVLVNLMQNAVNSMDNMEIDDKVVALKTAKARPDELSVSIWDRGRGIPPDRAESIFDPLYSDSLDGMGMGMGLAICKKIIDAHGGEIRHEPNPGGGTRFEFTVRIAPA